MNLAQLFLQLGICGAMLFVFWQIASKWIDKNAESEKQKTDTLAEGFRSMSGAVMAVATDVRAHSTADIASHGELAKGISENGKDIAEIRGLLAERSGVHVAALPDLPNPRTQTPARGIREMGPRFKTSGDR